MIVTSRNASGASPRTRAATSAARSAWAPTRLYASRPRRILDRCNGGSGEQEHDQHICEADRLTKVDLRQLVTRPPAYRVESSASLCGLVPFRHSRSRYEDRIAEKAGNNLKSHRVPIRHTAIKTEHKETRIPPVSHCCCCTWHSRTRAGGCNAARFRRPRTSSGDPRGSDGPARR